MLRLFQRRGLLDEPTVAEMLTWQGSGGFSLAASVRIHGSDSAGRERLLRYCARPPFAIERLHIEPPAHESNTAAPPGEAAIRRVRYRPARTTPDGRTVLVHSPLEFLAALSRLIPPPRVHRHRYHGVLAPNATLRQRVVSLSRGDDEPSIGPATTDTPPNAAGATEVEPSALDLPHSPQRTAARSRDGSHYEAELRGGVRIPVGRTRYKELRARML